MTDDDFKPPGLTDDERQSLILARIRFERSERLRRDRLRRREENRAADPVASMSDEEYSRAFWGD
jgi:hypothetical protein